MSRSLVSYNGKGEWATDSAIAVWLRLLAQQVDVTTDVPPWLRQLAQHWHMQATIGGGMDAHLSEVVTDSQKEALIRLVENALRRLDGYGPTIPVEVLNSLGVGGVKFTRDVNTEVFAQVGRLF